MIKLTDEDRAKYTPKKKQTNLEKIRAMSVEELAKHLIKLFECVNCPVCRANMCSMELPCSFNIKKWLLSESEVEE